MARPCCIENHATALAHSVPVGDGKIELFVNRRTREVEPFVRSWPDMPLSPAEAGRWLAGPVARPGGGWWQRAVRQVKDALALAILALWPDLADEDY